MKPVTAFLQARKPGRRRPLITWGAALAVYLVLAAANELQWPTTPIAWWAAGFLVAAFLVLWLIISCSDIEPDPEDVVTPLQQRQLYQMAQRPERRKGERRAAPRTRPGQPADMR